MPRVRSIRLRTRWSETDPAYGRLFVEDEPNRKIIEAVQSVAHARGVSMAMIALAWVLANPVVSAPIVGASRPHHLTDAVAALDITLTEEEITALEEHYTPGFPPGMSAADRPPARWTKSARTSAVSGMPRLPQAR
ncbi:aldo/keto reductase [Streptomyces sp. NBC_01166]|uniref:aldo/keto reductase n=1 Tax=Streptomyces sp. NBC_01166 TaxID=2903755 RepID=UPI00386DB159|nr:aldo/keto reductase [Streptomyces sp. NBC_01166]